MNFRFAPAPRLPAALLLFILIFTLAGAAQDAAQVSGVVRDSSGAVVPAATITIRSDAQGTQRTVSTSAGGFYTIPNLRPGSYTVLVQSKGFKEARTEILTIGVGEARSLDFQLQIGGAAETVTVSAEGQSVDTSSNRLGVNVSSQEVLELPVNGRNYSQLQLLSPGATNVGTGNFDQIHFNSRSNEQNQTKLDGVESTAIFDASPGYLTVQGSQFRLLNSLENIQEFRVDSSNYQAEYGTGTGGQINVVGKTGSNAFHGSLFEYIRNDKLDARNFFDPAGTKSPLRLNQFGGSLGGPIISNRWFFFGSYEGLRQRAGFNVIELTPSTSARDFINFAGTADPRGAAAAASLGLNPTPADLVRIQALRATNVINAFPVGTGAAIALGGLTNAAQFVQVNRTAKLDEDSFTVRTDFVFNDRYSGFIRYLRDEGTLLAPDGASDRLLNATQKPDNLVAAITGAYLSGRLINEVKFGMNHAPTALRTVFPGVTGSPIDFTRSAVNLSGSIVQPGINGGSPTGIASPGGLTRQSSAGNGRAQIIDPRSFSFIDNISLARGTHSLKFGGEVRLLHVAFDQLGGFQYTYGNIRDFLLNQNLTAAFIGDLSAPGDFQIATNPFTTVSRSTGGFHRGRQNYYIVYGQDEWRVTPNLTFSYGLRYEYYSPNRERDNRDFLFDAGRNQVMPASADFYSALSHNFAPRLGLAWSPRWSNGKTVIRLGGGLNYGPGQYEDLIQPIESDVFRTTRSIATGLTSGTPASVTDTSVPVVSFTPRAYNRNAYKVPERVGQYGLSVQQELPGSAVLTVGYVGSQGRNLFQRSITNLILPGQTTIAAGTALPSGFGIINEVNGAGQVVRVSTVRQLTLLNTALVGNALVPTVGAVVNPFGEIDFKTSGGTDSFNALQVAVTRRFAKGLTLGGQYQWAHSIGTTEGSNEAQTSQDPVNFAGERGNNTFDIRHSANVSVLYELPIGRAKALRLEGLADAVLGGWEIGGIFNARTGTPLDIRLTRADVVMQCVNAALCTLGTTAGLPGTINAGTPLPPGFTAVVNTPGGGASRNTRRPDLIPGVNPLLSANGLTFLNPAAFAIPRAGLYGNLSRNHLYGPNFNQLDFTVQKRFRFTERASLEFRTELYNIFNKTNFLNPPATLPNNLGALQPGQPFTNSGTTGAGNFGQINSTVGRTVGLGTNRQIQFSARVTF